MNQNLDVTEAEIIAGKKQITVRTRDGKDLSVIVESMGWRNALKAAAAANEGRMDESTIIAVEGALRNTKGNAELIDSLTMEALGQITGVAWTISNGLDAFRKQQAAS